MMGNLLDDAQNKLLFEMLNKELNTAYNVHAGTRLNQYTHSYRDLRKLSDLRRKEFRPALQGLMARGYVLEVTNSINSPDIVARKVGYELNDAKQDELLAEWGPLLDAYWQRRHEAENYQPAPGEI